jgi:Na+-translocating ferredoxin:NAD+ oxidoreductase subunit G
MAKTPSTFFHMISSLSVCVFISATALAGVYSMTKDKIALAKTSSKVALFKDVLPVFNNDPFNERYVVPTEKGELVLYPAKMDGVLVGVAVDTFSMKGYSGKVSVLAGFLPNGAIYDAIVTDHKETPGLGSKMEAAQSDFPLQFKGKDPGSYRLKVKKDGGDVDAITSATISSRAYCDALQTAYEAVKKVLK